MLKINMMQEQIFAFDADDKLAENVAQACEKLDWNQQKFNQRSKNYHLERKREFQAFRSWVNSCLNRVKNELRFSCDEMRVTQMWGNKALKGQTHHKHYHPNSVLSAVYYVTKDNAPTRLYAPSIYSGFSGSAPGGLDLFIQDNTKAWRMVEHRGTPGQPLIFPSTLQHDVAAQSSDDVRITLAINSFPSGFIGDFSQLSGFDR